MDATERHDSQRSEPSASEMSTSSCGQRLDGKAVATVALDTSAAAVRTRDGKRPEASRMRTKGHRALKAAREATIRELKKAHHSELKRLTHDASQLKAEHRELVNNLAAANAKHDDSVARVAELESALAQQRTATDVTTAAADASRRRLAAERAASAAAVDEATRKATEAANAAAEVRAVAANRQADDALDAVHRELRAAIAARDAAQADAGPQIEHPYTRMAIAAVEAARAKVVSGDEVTDAMRHAAKQHVDAHGGNMWNAVWKKKDWPLARAVQHLTATKQAAESAASTARGRDAWLGSVTDGWAVNALYFVGHNDAPKDVKVGMLAVGVSACAADDHGLTGLHGAAVSGDEEFAELLMALGADVNARTVKQGWTPLHYAAGWGKPGAMRVLVRAGADVSVRSTDEHIETAMETAKRFGHTAWRPWRHWRLSYEAAMAV